MENHFTKGKQSLATRIANSYCRRCNKKGHWKAECPLLNDHRSTSASESAPTSFAIVEELPDDLASIPLLDHLKVRYRFGLKVVAMFPWVVMSLILGGVNLRFNITWGKHVTTWQFVWNHPWGSAWLIERLRAQFCWIPARDPDQCINKQHRTS